MTRGSRIAVTVLVAWVVWMIAKALMPDQTVALAVFPATGVAVWLLTGGIAARRAAVAADEDYEGDEELDDEVEDAAPPSSR